MDQAPKSLVPQADVISIAVDDCVKTEMANQKIPGLSLAVVIEGKVVKARGYGLACLELGAPAASETLYGLGSISKQFTATAIVLLEEKGKLRLDAKIVELLDGLPGEWADVTVRHLLTHTSGIKEEQWKGGIVEFDRYEYKQEEVIKTAFGPLESKPGEKFAYRNVGYRLLGMIVEKISRQSYWDFLDEHIFKPLGMTATRNSDPRTIILHRARGYGRAGDVFVNRDPVTASAAFSEGALMSSVLDLVKWDAALNGEALLKKSSLAKMWTPVKLNNGTTYPYGFGWSLGDTQRRKTISHGGGLPGFVTYIGRFVDDKITVIVLTNCESSDAQQVAQLVAGFYVPALSPQK